MARRKSTNGENDVAFLLKHLLAIELYRSGLSQQEIRKRLGLAMNVVTQMLRGVSRHALTRIDDSE